MENLLAWYYFSVSCSVLFGSIGASLWCSSKIYWRRYSLVCLLISSCLLGNIIIIDALERGKDGPTWNFTLFKSEKSLVAGTVYERLGEPQKVNKEKPVEEKDGARFITVLQADGAKFPEAYALTKSVPERFVVSKKPDGSLEFVLHLPPDFVPFKTEAEKPLPTTTK